MCVRNVPGFCSSIVLRSGIKSVAFWLEIVVGGWSKLCVHTHTPLSIICLLIILENVTNRIIIEMVLSPTRDERMKEGMKLLLYRRLSFKI